MRTIGSLLLLTAWASAEEVRIPTQRPLRDFYGAAGSNVKIIANAEPRLLTPDAWTTYTLTITGIVNAADLEKPRLTKLPDFANDFEIDERPADAPAPADGRAFVYRLRPRSPNVSRIPALKFHYYVPGLAIEEVAPLQTFRVTWTSSLPIEVRVPSVEVPRVPTYLPPTANRWDWLNALGRPWALVLGTFAVCIAFARPTQRPIPDRSARTFLRATAGNIDAPTFAHALRAYLAAKPQTDAVWSDALAAVEGTLYGGQPFDRQQIALVRAKVAE